MPEIPTRPHDEPDKSVITWVFNASERGGSFIKHLALAAVYADAQNYVILRPVILRMKEKYPNYAAKTTDPRQGNLTLDPS